MGQINWMGNKRGGMTAGELIAQQATDLEYQAMRAAKDRELATIAEERRREAKALLKDLASAGATVDWVGRLCGIPDPDDHIYPVLLHHIAKPYSPWLLHWIGRAFGRKAARPIVWNTLVDLVKTHALEEHAAEGVMGAISDMARPSDLDTLIDLLSDPSLGTGRIFLISNLMRSKKPAARAALLRQKDDPQLNVEIRARLSRSRR